MNPIGTENHHQYLGDQMATNRGHQLHTTQPHSASDPAAVEGCQPGRHSVAEGSTRDEFSRAKAQQICMRGEELARQCREAFLNGERAERDLIGHMYKSQPLHLRASSSRIRRFWFSVHHKVATVALRQVHRRVHQLGLTRVSDTKGFLAKHCGWYLRFCSFSRFLYP